ncbi:MAG: DUF58 domain-containing protein [bacterium]
MSDVDPSEVPGLGTLELKVRELMEGRHLGIHQSPHRGASVEFAEHRPYQPGDDIRNLDWSLFARTDRLYIKRYEKYTELSGDIFVDASDSMGFGEKWSTAQLLAGAMAYLLSAQGDQPELHALTSDVKQVPSSRNRNQHRRVIRVLEETDPEGNRRLSPYLSRWLHENREPSLLVLCSDFISEDPEVLNDLMDQAHGRGHDVVTIHIVSREELELPGEGPVRFTDPESGETIDTDVDGVRQEYRNQFQSFLDRIKSLFIRRGMGYLRVVAEENPAHQFGDFIRRRNRQIQRTTGTGS